jgi:hypothetical protein
MITQCTKCRHILVLFSMCKLVFLYRFFYKRLCLIVGGCNHGAGCFLCRACLWSFLCAENNCEGCVIIQLSNIKVINNLINTYTNGLKLLTVSLISEG